MCFRHKLILPRYVEILEQQQAQLVAGLQVLYKRARHGQGWVGTSLKERPDGNPPIHDILERLASHQREGHVTTRQFEEDLDLLQRRLIASGAEFMPRETRPYDRSDSAPSFSFERVPPGPVPFAEPLAPYPFAPIPSNQSTYPRISSSHIIQMQRPTNFDRSATDLTLNHSQTWPFSTTGLSHDLDFIEVFDSFATLKKVEHVTISDHGSSIPPPELTQGGSLE